MRSPLNCLYYTTVIRILSTYFIDKMFYFCKKIFPAEIHALARQCCATAMRHRCTTLVYESGRLDVRFIGHVPRPAD